MLGNIFFLLSSYERMQYRIQRYPFGNAATVTVFKLVQKLRLVVTMEGIHNHISKSYETRDIVNMLPYLRFEQRGSPVDRGTVFLCDILRRESIYRIEVVYFVLIVRMVYS